MGFSKYFSEQQFKLLIESRKNMDSDDSTENVKRNWKIMEQEFLPALKEYLSDLRAQGQISITDGFDGFGLKFLPAWNRFVQDNCEDRDWKTLSERFVLVVFWKLIMFTNDIKDLKLPEDAALQTAYKQLTDFVTNGDIRCFFLGDGDICYVTSQRIRYEMNQWHLNAGLYEGKGEDLLPPVQPEKPGARINTIHLKTGHLLIADWFRIEEFTKATDDITDSNDICHIKGREDEQRRLAENFNFFSVHASGSPHIFQKDGILVFGFMDEEQDDYDAVAGQYNELGRVFTELRNVTIIEKENLIDIVASKIEHETATKKVDAYLNENKDSITYLNVAHGDYHCYSCGDTRNFHKYIAEFEMPGTMINEPLFVLSDKLLEPKEDLGMSPG